jgi:chromosome segregation ATPase
MKIDVGYQLSRRTQETPMSDLFLPAVASPLETLEPLNDRARALAEREHALERERQQFAADQKLVRVYWRRRCQEEWDRLRAEAGRHSASFAQQQQALLEKQTELELRRRDLDQRWQEFQMERRAWHEQRARQQGELDCARQELEAEQRRLADAQQQWRQARMDAERLRIGGQRELDGLEKRIANYRELLQHLQSEVALLEESASGKSGSTSAPAASAAPPASGVLMALTRLVDDLRCEHQRLVASRLELIGLRESWGLEWDRAQQRLETEAAGLQEKVEAAEERRLQLQRLAALLQRQADELALKRRQLRSEEDSAARQHAAQRCAAARVLAKVQAKGLAARNRWRQAQRLLADLHREEVRQMARREEIEKALALSQQALFERHERLDYRETWLDQREKDLLAREWVVAQAEQQLIHRDPDPRGANAELERRLEVFRRLGQRAAGRDADRSAELREALADLEAFRQRLLAARNDLDAERVQLQLLRMSTMQERELLDAERASWRVNLQRFREERRRLAEQNRDLEGQVERLTVMLLETPSEAPRLALAA